MNDWKDVGRGDSKESDDAEYGGGGHSDLDVLNRSHDRGMWSIWELSREPLVDGIGLVDAVEMSATCSKYEFAMP